MKRLSLEKTKLYLVYAVPFSAVICFSCWCLIAVRPTHAWDDAEPEILNQAWRLSRSEPIYRTIDSPPYVHTAYPPLYFAVVAPLLKLGGLSYLPAKLISLLSALSIGFAMARLSQMWRRKPGWGIWALSLLFLLPAFLYNTVRAHVQMLAVALAIWSFVLILEKSRRAAIASAFVAVLAVYTKQTGVALPIATLVYLTIHERHRLLAYAATLVMAGLPPLLWLQRETGGHFLNHIVRLNSLSYSFSEIPLVLIHHAGPFFLFITLAALEVWRRIRSKRLEPIDYYFASVLLMTVFSCGRLGAHTQYVVELSVVTMLVLLHRGELGRTPRRDWIIVLQILILLVYAPFYVFIEAGQFARASNRAAREIYPLLETVPGTVLSQQGSFSLFARGEIPIQLFHFTALARAGLWDIRKLQREVEEASFAWVITEFPIESDRLSRDDLERFTPEIVAALRQNYRRETTIPPYFVYRPLLR